MAAAAFAKNLEAHGHIAVGFWIGETYEFMRGFRFVAKTENVLRFVDLLDIDERTLSQPGVLPKLLQVIVRSFHADFSSTG